MKIKSTTLVCLLVFSCLAQADYLLAAISLNDSASTFGNESESESLSIFSEFKPVIANTGNLSYNVIFEGDTYSYDSHPDFVEYSSNSPTVRNLVHCLTDGKDDPLSYEIYYPSHPYEEDYGSSHIAQVSYQESLQRTYPDLKGYTITKVKLNLSSWTIDLIWNEGGIWGSFYVPESEIVASMEIYGHKTPSVSISSDLSKIQCEADQDITWYLESSLDLIKWDIIETFTESETHTHTTTPEELPISMFWRIRIP